MHCRPKARYRPAARRVPRSGDAGDLRPADPATRTVSERGSFEMSGPGTARVAGVAPVGVVDDAALDRVSSISADRSPPFQESFKPPRSSDSGSCLSLMGHLSRSTRPRCVLFAAVRFVKKTTAPSLPVRRLLQSPKLEQRCFSCLHLTVTGSVTPHAAMSTWRVSQAVSAGQCLSRLPTRPDNA